MANILVQEVKNRGISSFMHRLETSHSLYFNVKYKRTGALEFFEPDWKERGQVRNLDGALQFLKKYRWSSLPAYLTQGASLDQIVDKASVMDQFDNNHEDYWKFIKEWLEPDSDHNYIYDDK